MGLILCLFCIIALSCYLSAVNYSSIGYGIAAIVGFINLLFILGLFYSIQLNKVNVNLYKDDISYIESLSKLSNISVDDRNKAINIVRTDNNIIIKHRTLYKNIWIGLYFSKEIANLKLLDYSSIPPSNPNSTINLIQKGESK